MATKFSILKVEVPTRYKIPGFHKGYGWELRDDTNKKIIDLFPSKAKATDKKRELKKSNNH